MRTSFLRYCSVFAAGVLPLVVSGIAAALPEVPVLDNITGAGFDNPIASWAELMPGQPPPYAGQYFYHTFHVEQEVFMTSVEAAISLNVSFSEADFALYGTLVHLDGPDAGYTRTGWATFSADGVPALDLVEDGLERGVHLYRREFGFPIDLDPGSYAVAIYALQTLANPYSPPPSDFRVLQSSVGDASGFVAPPNINFPAGEIDFTEWMGQGLNAAIRVNVYDVPSPGALGVLAMGGMIAVRRRR